MTWMDERFQSTAEDADGEGDSSAVTPPADELYRALAAAPRRRVLYHLLHESPASPDELADLLAGWEATTRDGAVGPERRTTLVTELHHVHLPLLEDTGLVTRDGDAEGVRITPIAEPVADAIRSAVEYEEVVADRSG